VGVKDIDDGAKGRNSTSVPAILTGALDPGGIPDAPVADSKRRRRSHPSKTSDESNPDRAIAAGAQPAVSAKAGNGTSSNVTTKETQMDDDQTADKWNDEIDRMLP
jgi:hypothetical protein